MHRKSMPMHTLPSTRSDLQQSKNTTVALKITHAWSYEIETQVDAENNNGIADPSLKMYQQQI